MVPCGPAAPMVGTQLADLLNEPLYRPPTIFITLREKIHRIGVRVNNWCPCDSHSIWNIPTVSINRREGRTEGPRIDQRSIQAIDDPDDILVRHHNDKLAGISIWGVYERFRVEHLVDIVRILVRNSELSDGTRIDIVIRQVSRLWGVLEAR
jgi:hypothetical protein